MLKLFHHIKDFFYWEIYNRFKGNNQNVVCGVVVYEGKILAQTAQRNTVIHTDDTQYIVPGGKVEKGETLNAALHREFKEETNLNIDVVKKLGAVRNNKYKLYWFVCRPTDVSMLKVMEPNKQKELKWVDLNDSSINWTPKNYEALMKYKNEIEKIQKMPPEVL
jgi:ADP-ribose pyrophosphatase YjhB (NUDIX family)